MLKFWLITGLIACSLAAAYANFRSHNDGLACAVMVAIVIDLAWLWGCVPKKNDGPHHP